MNNDNKLLQVPLIHKESSDLRYIKIIKWIVCLLIICNLCWASTLFTYNKHMTNLLYTQQGCTCEDCVKHNGVK